MSDDENTLIASARAGDQRALQQLLWNHYGSLIAHITPKLSGNLRRLIAVEDVAQETLAHAIRDIHNCQAESDASFAAWIMTVADNRLHDIVKGLCRKKRGGNWKAAQPVAVDSGGRLMNLVELVSDERSTPGRKVARHEAVRAMQVGIAALPDEQRDALRLRYFEGKSIEETAAQLRRSPAAVNGLVRRAKEALRGTLHNSSLWLSRH